MGKCLKSLLQIVLNQQHIVLIDSLESSPIQYELTKFSALSFQIRLLNNNLFSSYTKDLGRQVIFVFSAQISAIVNHTFLFWHMKGKASAERTYSMQLFC